MSVPAIGHTDYPITKHPKPVLAEKRENKIIPNVDKDKIYAGSRKMQILGSNLT